MDIVRLHERALDETARLIGNVQPDQMGLPTPCSDWNVRALLAHLVGGNARYAAAATGEPMGRGLAHRGGPAADLLGDDPAGAYRRSAVAVDAAWRNPTLLDRTFEFPFGTVPGRVAVGMHLLETVTHGWDLAKATGQQPAFDPAVVQAATHVAQSSLPSDRPPGTPFAAPVLAAHDLPELDRLAAFLGRTP